MKSWIVFLLAVITLLTLIFWVFFGSIPITVKGKGIIITQSGLVTIQTKLTGTIAHIYAKTGSQIKKGELLFDIYDPQLELKLLSAISKVKIRENELAYLKEQMEKEELAEKAALIIKIEATRFAIAQIEEELAFLNKQLQSHKELVEEGLIVASVYRNDEQKLVQLSIELEGKKGDLASFLFQIQKEYRPEELRNKEHELLIEKEERDLLQIAIDQGKMYSLYNGQILEVIGNVGDLVQAGSPIMWVENLSSFEEKENYVIYGYFPVERGKRIHVGTPIEMTISTIDRNQYGTLLGQVDKISLFAVSKENIFNKIQNPVLVNYLADQNSAVFEVIIRPEYNPSTPSQLLWSSGFSPPIPISTGTIGELEAEVEKIRPIFYLLPLPALKNYQKSAK